jgi:integrase
MVDVTVQHRDGREERVRRVAPIQNRRAAEHYEHELRQSLLDGSFHAPKKEVTEVPTLASFAEAFVETYAETNNKPSEVRAKKKILRVHLVPALGTRKLDTIGVEEIERYKATKLKAGLAPKTINNHLTVLHKLLVVAREWGRLRDVPPVQWMHVPAPEFEFLTFDEADALMAAADSEWRAMVTLGLKAGLRQGELLALRWTDVDLTAGRMLVRRNLCEGHIGTPKGGRGRELPLGDIARTALEAHPRRASELVFAAPDGKALTSAACKWPLWRACTRAGLRRIGWHALRHTFASHLAMLGAPLKAIQELLGHATIEMTMRYAHLIPEVARQTVQLLDRHGTMAAHERAEVQITH